MLANGKSKPVSFDQLLLRTRSLRLASKSGANRLSPWMMTIDINKNRGNPTTIAHTDNDRLKTIASSNISAMIIIEMITNTLRIPIQPRIRSQISLTSSSLVEAEESELYPRAILDAAQTTA